MLRYLFLPMSLCLCVRMFEIVSSVPKTSSSQYRYRKFFRKIILSGNIVGVHLQLGRSRPDIYFRLSKNIHGWALSVLWWFTCFLPSLFCKFADRGECFGLTVREL